MQQRHIHDDDFMEGKTPMISRNPDRFMRADHIPGPGQGNWTYSHYAALPDDGQRYEIVNGVLYTAPSPIPPHQEIGSMIIYWLVAYVKRTGLGRVFEYCDVELDVKTVFDPDIIVVLSDNTSIIGDKHMVGAPDLVVEIASPSTAPKDRTLKRFEYARAGIKEYWMVLPKKQSVEVLVLEGEAYQSLGIFSGEDIVKSKVVPHFPVQAKEFFV